MDAARKLTKYFFDKAKRSCQSYFEGSTPCGQQDSFSFWPLGSHGWADLLCLHSPKTPQCQQHCLDPPRQIQQMWRNASSPGLPYLHWDLLHGLFHILGHPACRAVMNRKHQKLCHSFVLKSVGRTNTWGNSQSLRAVTRCSPLWPYPVHEMNAFDWRAGSTSQHSHI